MSYSKSLVHRIRQAVAGRGETTEKKMFGGVAFLLRGNMLVGVWKNSLIARLGADQAETALLDPHVKAFDITGRPMKGWVMVEPEGIETDGQLQQWIELARTFVGELPEKNRHFTD